jgi:transcriptional regulator with XRE-family HTH domain
MASDRPHSPQAIEAAQLLGEKIRIARRERRWSQRELAERIGITPRTLAKVEAGDLSVGLGTVFEAAALVGVPLFYPDRSRLSAELDRARARGSLLPGRIRPRGDEVKDDF